MEDERQVFDAFINSYLFSLKYLQDFLSAPAEKYGVSFDQFLIMHEIKMADGDVTLMELSKAHQVSRSAISRQISGLLDAKYVSQQTDADDRRRRILRLTDEGNQVEEKLFKEGLDRAHNSLNIFGADRISTMLKFINEFTREVMSKDNEKMAQSSKTGKLS
ncbi:helix-turn-helix domain-containing protein [Paucilactobacillus suebicus]|nr:helix-turn-helix domain-containing protein [Paucilactobacillus suebicus]